MLKIWREIRLFEITGQRLADQTKVIRTNDWLSTAKLVEIQRKSKERENMEESRIELQNIYEEKPHKEIECWTDEYRNCT